MTPFVIACECQASFRQRVFRHVRVGYDLFHEACLQNKKLLPAFTRLCER
jgi:hypothetical protein